MALSGRLAELSDWHQAPRVRPLNDRLPAQGGRYVLCWLQQALRACDNPVIDAAVRLGNALHLPVLVYHGVREDYPYASDRLHHFILRASIDLAEGCRQRGLACVQHVERAERREKGLVYRLGVAAAAIVVEDQPTFVARWQSERVAARVDVPVLAVNAACLVPPAVIGRDVQGRTAFLRRHEPARAAWAAWDEEIADVAAYSGALPFTPDTLRADELGTLIAGLDIDHSVPVTPMHPAGRNAAEARLTRLVADVLPGYASNRNDATRLDSASGLSPYLHFGVLGPREVMAAVNGAAAGGQHKRKFADELLGWREWFHYQARHLDAPERYDRIAPWARQTLTDHAGDLRPDQETLSAMLRGETRDETWNACQRQFLAEGWMHNNLRMYWCKRIIAMTPSPEAAWATACYLNDRLSLDGRDPSTYGNIAMMFAGAPTDREGPVYGRVATRGDGSTRHRAGGDAWLATAASRPVPLVSVPGFPPVDPYLAS
ncbi:deoxyribodipyrimidine photo-lyase [Sphingomonas sp. 10B4]|uniref:deoxyribodipyrimidine photo-lyase n=1 Tax=Sphingomonas sp. 10B4 TaxID=3048575 RepID=UPI002AB4F0D8|nr:deoxyribodipyrimidine photo-lyase [Sphingomonas sp. 10B4]MDY7525843.1 deoxyribodipyrimidine photo-lyase [Sphingomonas sp. 10B4]MEB0281658.1 deoxyribodipyrimidine photo-lyase [Sphingomonas sp. 10B4]